MWRTVPFTLRRMRAWMGTCKHVQVPPCAAAPASSCNCAHASIILPSAGMRSLRTQCTHAHAHAHRVQLLQRPQLILQAEEGGGAPQLPPLSLLRSWLRLLDRAVGGGRAAAHPRRPPAILGGAFGLIRSRTWWVCSPSGYTSTSHWLYLDLAQGCLPSCCSWGQSRNTADSMTAAVAPL